MRIAVIGAGGHARSVATLCEKLGHTVQSLVETGIFSEAKSSGYLLTPEGYLTQNHKTIDGLVMGIGLSITQGKKRIKFNELKSLGFGFPKIVSVESIIDSGVEISEGSVIFPGVIINRDVKLGSWLTVSHGSILEHDVSFGSNCFVGPGAILCGGVEIQDDVVIGAGATILPGVSVGFGATIGAGSVVTKNVASQSIVLGNPARKNNE